MSLDTILGTSSDFSTPNIAEGRSKSDHVTLAHSRLSSCRMNERTLPGVRNCLPSTARPGLTRWRLQLIETSISDSETASGVGIRWLLFDNIPIAQ